MTPSGTSVLTGTTALVTGASSGIGEATAVSLAASGARVALVARRRDRLKDLAARIEGDGGTALVIEADVTDQAQAQDAVAQTVERLGRLDVLVNNAGVMLLGPAEHAPVEEWQRMVELNVLGLMYCAHAAIPHLLASAQDGPRQVADMVNFSSVAGRVARTGSGVYNATKFGVGAFSESLRQEFTIATHLMREPDMAEGIRALLVDKDKDPTWSPARLEDVSAEDVAGHFEPVPGVDPLQPG